MDKYFKIQELINRQKEKRDKILEVFEIIFNQELKLTEKIKLEVIFSKEEAEISNIKVKIKDKSSIKFIVLKNKEKIIENYKSFYPKDTFIVV